MNKLGERINKYRTARGLSQLELSELLEVSRQSISKWETDVAVPDLAKLVKMAELFGISLDELVLGKVPEGEEIKEEKEEVPEVPAPVKEEKPYSRIKSGMGFMFLGVGILLGFFILLMSGDIVGAIVCFMPFGVSAFFCLKQFRHAALWCAETWYVFIIGYFHFASGVDWNPRVAYLLLEGEDGLNLITVMSFVFFFMLVGFICLTVFAYRKDEIRLSKKNHIVLAVVTALALPIKSLVRWLIYEFQINVVANGDMDYYLRVIYMNNRVLISVFEFLIDFAFIATFTACLVPTFYWVVGLIKGKRVNK